MGLTMRVGYGQQVADVAATMAPVHLAINAKSTEKMTVLWSVKNNSGQAVQAWVVTEPSGQVTQTMNLNPMQEANGSFLCDPPSGPDRTNVVIVTGLSVSPSINGIESRLVAFVDARAEPFVFNTGSNSQGGNQMDKVIGIENFFFRINSLTYAGPGGPLYWRCSVISDVNNALLGVNASQVPSVVVPDLISPTIVPIAVGAGDLYVPAVPLNNQMVPGLASGVIEFFRAWNSQANPADVWNGFSQPCGTVRVRGAYNVLAQGGGQQPGAPLVSDANVTFQ